MADHVTDHVPEVLFAKISDEDRDIWAQRFSGIRD